MPNGFDHEKLAKFLAQKAAEAMERAQLETHDRVVPPKGPSLEELKERAQEKRDRNERTFQKAPADKPPINDPDPQVVHRRTVARSMANDQYVGKTTEVKGISQREVEEIQSRGPKEDLRKVPPAQPLGVPTRSRDTYQRAAKLGQGNDDPRKYDDEDKRTGTFRRPGMGEARTPYYEGAEQEKHRLEVKDSQLTRQGQPLDTTAAAGGHLGSSAKRSEIFAMDTKGNLYATDPVSEPGPGPVTIDPHHSSLVHGEDVIGAGDIGATGGVVRSLSDRSGHYQTTPAQMADVVNEMEERKVPMIDQTLQEPPLPPGQTARGHKDRAMPVQKRAKVELGSEAEKNKTTMDFERFSQTGGNLEEVKKKQENVVSQIQKAARYGRNQASDSQQPEGFEPPAKESDDASDEETTKNILKGSKLRNAEVLQLKERAEAEKAARVAAAQGDVEKIKADAEAKAQERQAALKEEMSFDDRLKKEEENFLIKLKEEEAVRKAQDKARDAANNYQ